MSPSFERRVMNVITEHVKRVLCASDAKERVFDILSINATLSFIRLPRDGSTGQHNPSRVQRRPEYLIIVNSSAF